MVTHYEVLGVAHRATPAEVRRAYVTLAREHHPDFHTGDGAAARDASAARMRDVNEAWRVLSDPDRRAAYDRQVHGGSRPGPSGSRAYDPGERAENSTTPGWIPPDDDDDWDPSMLDDTPLNGVKPRRSFALAPFGLFALGVLLLVVGFVVSAGLTAIGLILIVLSAVGFVVVPFLTMVESRERDLGG